MAGPRKAIQRFASLDAGARVSASKFKDSCLQLIDRVQRTREEIVVTRYGQPVAKLVAYDRSQPRLFGRLAGSVTILGDVVAPIGEEWDAG